MINSISLIHFLNLIRAREHFGKVLSKNISYIVAASENVTFMTKSFLQGH